MQTGLKGRAAVVLAASQGLGKGVALGLAREGADLVVCSRKESKIAAVAEEIARETGVRVIPVAADVTQREELEGVIERAVREFGRLDVLVNNAGGPPPGRFEDFDDDAWLAAFELNFLSAVRAIRAALPHMRRQGGGRIINLISSSVKQPIPNLILSNSVRAAVVGMAKTLSLEVARDGITVNNVAPGRIHTERVEQLDRANAERSGRSVEEVRQAAEAEIPLGRYGTPEEFASAVVFLASDAARYITGVTLQVDGGMIRGLF